jgi:hypothetical protein
MVTLQFDARGEGKVARELGSSETVKSLRRHVEVLSGYCLAGVWDVPSDLM